MTTLTFKVPDAVAAALEERARHEHSTKSALMRDALNAFLHDGTGGDSGPSCYDLARSVAGCVKDGPPDLSYNKEHMEGFGRD